jgi:hypothetical protein
LPQELADVKQRLARVDAALAELSRVEAAGETVPSRLPLTDPESRMTPNKDGGFAPNYTPLATVDAAHGFIVADDVIAMTDEEHYLVPQIQAVQENFQLASPPAEMLGDGAMPSGENLTALEAMGVTLYSPIGAANGEENPALREDVTQPVAAELWDRLPTIEVKNRSGEKQTQLTKEAFVYAAGNDCYWCPGGKKLSPQQPISLRRGKRLVQRTCYKAEQAACAACPLRDRCLQKNAQRRQVSRYLHDPLAEKLARRMATPEAKKKYARRREVCERPFAVIKQQFGARRFLLRGLAKVRIEWRWLTTAFNLDRLMSLLRNRDGPAAVLS